MLLSTSSIEVCGVTKQFGRGTEAVRVLDDVSVAIRPQEFFTLLGPSGCGKTTLLRLIAGFEQASAGEIRIAGTSVNDLPPFKRRVNTVFQSYALFPHLTVEQNVAFGLEMKRLPKPEVRARVEEALNLVQMPHLAKRRPAQLSGGQQQRVALARALAPKPDVLLLDEPLSALDLKLRKEMQVELKRVQHEAGITFVFVTHDQEEALTMSDRIAVMSGGKILQIGTPLEIYERPQRRFVADFIGEINFVEGMVASSDDGLIRIMLKSGAGNIACPASATHLSGLLPGENVTVAIRPERATLCDPGEACQLAGEIAQIVYIGTATVYHVRCRGGETFVLRESNMTGGGCARPIGSQVGIQFPADAVQLLGD